MSLMEQLLKKTLLGLLTATLFSGFIYFEYFGLTNYLINSIFGIAAFYLLLTIPKKAVLVAGFFIGLFWFYWIGYSFKYTGVGYITPFVTFGFGIIYTLFFSPLAFTNKSYMRATFLFALSFFEPFSFNWMKFELLFTQSYFGVQKWQLALILVALVVAIELPKKYKALALAFLVGAIDFSQTKVTPPPLKIKLVQTHILQQEKWLLKNQYSIVQQNFQAIKKAIKQHYDLVVLPESTFPLYLNTQPQLIALLKELSLKIAIVTGALYYENGKNYNVSYFFEDGKMQIAKKMVLVPFGEYIPLPKFMQKIINDFFFNGEADFSHANNPTDFIIKGTKFRNAICYEATTDAIFKGDVKYVIAISNNGWFVPSIEPTLQNLLMKFYSKKYGVMIYHSANAEGGGVIY